MSGISWEELVDPLIYGDRPGSSHDPGAGEEPVNYLRRLKAGLPETATAGSPASVGMGARERRQTPRIQCSGSVEFQVENSEGQLWGSLTDISFHGCYIEMPTTFPVDTKVQLLLTSLGIRIHVPGIVRAAYPFLGMGIRFAQIEPEQQENLRELLSKLTGRKSVSEAEPPAAESPKGALTTADPQLFLDQVIEFFREKPLLSRKEFYEIAQRVRRP